MPRRRKGQEQFTRFEVLMIVVLLLELAGLFYVLNSNHPMG